MPRKAKVKKDERHQLTITVWTVDKPIAGDEYMKIESTEVPQPEDPKERSFRLAAEIMVAAGIEVGNHVEGTDDLAFISSRLINAMLKAALMRLRERNPEALAMDPLAAKLGISANQLQEMKDLLQGRKEE